MVKCFRRDGSEIELECTIDEFNHALSWNDEFKFNTWASALNECGNESAIIIANDYHDEMS
jgi:hypothetical protein